MLWDRMQMNARRGYVLGRMILDKANTTYPSTTGMLLNRQALQARIEQPKVQRVLVKGLGEDGYNALVDSLTSGAGLGARDVVPMAPATLTGAASQLARSGGGASTGLLAPLRTALPGLGDTYAGRQPYAIPEDLRTLMDLVLTKTIPEVPKGKSP